MKPKHQRLIFIAISMVFLVTAALFTMQAFRQNIVFYFSPSELAKQHPKPTGVIRVGGLVETNSIKDIGNDAIEFSVTDGTASLIITYTGMLPTLFREGQGVVAEGSITDARYFKASRVLTKHDENYMPPEVVDSLKKSGRWKDMPTP